MAIIKCAICTENYAESDHVTSTPCGHIYHNTCLSQWLSRASTCPQCRELCQHDHCLRVYFDFADDDEICNKNLLIILDDTLKESTLQKDALEKEKKISAQLSKELKECQQEIKKLIESLRMTKKESTDLQQNLIIKENIIQRLNERCMNSDTKIAELRHAVDKSQWDLYSEKSKYSMEIVKTKENTNKLSQELTLCQANFNELCVDFVKAEKQAMLHEWQLNQKEDSIKNLNRECLNGRTEIEKSRKTIAQLEHSLNYAAKISNAQHWELIVLKAEKLETHVEYERELEKVAKASKVNQRKSCKKENKANGQIEENTFETENEKFGFFLFVAIMYFFLLFNLFVDCYLNIPF